MLVQLRVSNYALIEELSLNFSAGLNIFSGETGAGKSIVIGAINLLLGERATIEQIRQGQETACIEGIISPNAALQEDIENLLDSAGITGNVDLIIAREIYRNGRSVARVNGRAVPVSFLKEMGQLLVDLHGQHQHQSLLRPEQHLDLLDSFGGDEIIESRRNLAELYKKRHGLKSELSALGDSSAERERRVDIASFQLKEIRDAAINPSEDDELVSRERILANSEKICTLTEQAYADIYEGGDNAPVEAIIDRLNRSSQLLSEAADLDQSLSPLVEMLASALVQLEEVSHELRDYKSGLEFDPGELVMIQERLNLINSFKRKYGQTIEEVLSFADRTELELERLQDSEAVAFRIEAEIKQLEQRLSAESAALRAMRKKTAGELEKLLEESFQELALPNARFQVFFAEKESFSRRGMDTIEFLFSANRGEEVKPLSKIISGGEVARVMLALKTILARQDLVPTLIFDEVDSGIGGATIQSVAEKLSHLSFHHQVMCVTHSPQIAAMADNHIRLYKETVGERTITKAVKLTDGDKREELARMLDGASIDQVSLKHVDSLMERAQRFKEGIAG